MLHFPNGAEFCIERLGLRVQIVGAIQVSNPIHPDLERAETLLRPMMPDRFSVIYEPEMPGEDGKIFRWFQVVFAVGPGDTAVLRAQVHELFPMMLVALSPLASVRQADVVSLRARRFLPDQDSGFDRPYMFIQADWAGAAVRQIRVKRNFSIWADECLAYRNYDDKGDIFNKRPRQAD